MSKLENVVALYPGKFKPFTGGHYSIVRKYLDSSAIEKLILVISRKDKDGFNAEDTKAFVEELFADEIDGGRLEVYIAATPSPIGWCYDYAVMLGEDAEDDDLYKLCLVSSTKGTDSDRISSFEKGFMSGGKYENEHILIVDPKIDIEPLVYKDRKDNGTGYKTGDPVSGTAAREDIRQDNFEAFKSNYPQEYFKDKKDILRRYFDTCKETLKEGDVNEGGAAGHMAHVVDVNEFTFDDYKDIISGVLENKFEMTEKVDGLNCFMTYKNGEFLIARNKTHLRGNPLHIQDLPTAFSTSTIGEIYYVACLELSGALKTLGNNTLEKIFAGGDKWVNFEIIDADFANIVAYSRSMIILHNMQTADDGKANYDEGGGYDIEYILDNIDSNAKGRHFEIKGPVRVDIDVESNEFVSLIEQKKKEFIGDIDNIRKRYNLANDDTMVDFMYIRIEDFLDKKGVDIPRKYLNKICDRWIYNDKSVSINKLLNGLDKNTYEALRSYDKVYNKIEQVLKRPIHNIFVKVGDFLLSMLSNMVNNSREAKEATTGRIKKRISDVKDNIPQDIINDYTDAFDNIYTVNPAEGVVFRYKGYTLKLTGSFYYINKVFHLGQEGAFAAK